MTIGSMVEQWLSKLDWFSTLFPRIPVPVQKKLEEKLRTRRQKLMAEDPARFSQREEVDFGDQGGRGDCEESPDRPRKDRRR